MNAEVILNRWFLILCVFIITPNWVYARYQAESISANGEYITADSLVALVLEQNPSLMQLAAASEAAFQQVKSAGTLDDPQLSYALAPETIDGVRLPNGEHRGLNQRIELSQIIPWPGTLALRTAHAQSEAEASQQDLADQRLQIISAIKAAFGEWYYVHQVLQINYDNQSLLLELRNVAEGQYAASRASQQDVLQAELAHARLLDQALSLERERLSIQAQLNALLNRAPDESVPPPAEITSPAPLPDFTNLQQKAQKFHPELMRIRAQLDSTQAKIELAEKDFYPDFKLLAGYNSLWDEYEKRWIIGASINIPLNRSKYQAQLNSAKANAKELHWSLIDRRAQLLANLKRAHAEVNESIRIIDLYQERLVPLANENLQVAEADYRSGAGDFINVTTAENEKLTTELRLARAQADYIRRVAELERWSGVKLSSGDYNHE